MRTTVFPSGTPSIDLRDPYGSLKDILRTAKLLQKTGPIKTKAKVTQEVHDLSKSEF